MPKNKWVRLTLILILLVGSYSYIIFKLKKFNNWEVFSIDSSRSIQLLAFVGLLFGFNIFFEAKKWQNLISVTLPVSFKIALKMVLAGFTSGIITPFRTGEPIGKIAFVNKAHWKNIAMLTYLGGAIQTAIILVGGVVGIAMYPNVIPINSFEPLIIGIVVAITILILFIGINSKRINGFPKKLSGLLEPFRSLKKRIIVRVISYSSIRYLIFCLQLYIALRYLGGNNLPGIGLIFIYYLCITILPSHILIDVGIRGSIAIALFNPYFNDPAIIVGSVFGIWLINQALPSFIGGIILWYKRI